MNKYIIYSENAKSESGYAAEYQSVARDENHVREMAEASGYDIEGYYIELIRTDVRDGLRRPCEPYFEADFS